MTDTPTLTYTVDADQLRAALSDLVAAAGSQVAAAEGLGISAVYLSDVIRGRRDVGALAGRLGYAPLTVYVPNGEPVIGADQAARVIEALRRRRMQQQGSAA